MAETRRVSSAPPSPARRRLGARPVLPHPPRHNSPSRVSSEGTLELRSPERAEEPTPPVPARPVEAPPKPVLRSHRPAPMPPRTGAERLVLAVLLLGLTLNAIVLLRHAELSHADLLLGATVLLAGVTLLVLMEVYRRTG